MKVLVNYYKEERKYLPILSSLLKKRGVSAAATPELYGISDLLAVAKKAEANAILVCNEKTLANLVQVPAGKKPSLDSFRGSRLNFSTPAIVINSLAQLHTVKYGRFILENDLGKLDFLAKAPIQLAFSVCETSIDFYNCFEELKQALVLSIDIETDWYSRITCISFTGLFNTNTTKTWVIPLIDFGIDHFQTDPLYQMAIACIRALCDLPCPKMMFNNTYDTQILITYGAYPRNLVIDVMGMAHSIYSELPKSLDFVTSLHCYDYYYWKHENEISKKNRDIRAQWGYCAKDSWWTLRCFLVMSKNFPAYAMKNYQILYKHTYPFLYCAFEGILIDEKERESLRAVAEAKLTKALADIRTMAAYKDFNPGSPKQVASLLYDIIGAKVIKRTEKGLPSTNNKVLSTVSLQHPMLALIIDPIIAYRKDAKSINTYFDLRRKNERLLYSIGPFATDTGRPSSHGSNFVFPDPDSDKGFSNYGTEIQNIPSYAKSMMIADPGFTIAEADNSKSEARVVAFKSRCEALKIALADPDHDFYKLLGTIFFNIPYESVTKEMREKVLKRIIHGTNYMMGIDTFIETAGVKKVMEAMQLLNMEGMDIRSFVAFLLGIYHKRFPEVARHYVEIKREILSTGRLVSEVGYTRIFFGDIVNSHPVLRGAVAHEPQSLSVMILYQGFWKVWKLCYESEGALRLKAHIYDSIFTQIRDDLVHHYRPLILEAMNNPVTINDEVLRIPVEFKVGKNWKDLESE